jgi:hypothetical protein
MISVITPAKTNKGLKIIADSLKKQTFTDWEWLICCPEEPIELGLPEDKDITWLLDEFKGGYWTLNRAYNWLASEARGELLVSWQDFIQVNPDGLQKFWDAHLVHPNDLITGVGDQYEKIENGKPINKIWFDPRKTKEYGTFYEITYLSCEYNWCAIPKNAINEIGFADSVLDFLGYGAELFEFGDRYNDFGGHFWIDQTNESFTLRQERLYKDWDRYNVLMNGTGIYWKRKEELKKEGLWPNLNK